MRHVLFIEIPTPGTPIVPGKNNKTPDSGLQTPSNMAAATAAITSTSIASTGQRTTEAVITASTAASKSVKFPTTISDDTGVDDKGTAETENTQDQANKSNHT